MALFYITCLCFTSVTFHYLCAAQPDLRVKVKSGIVEGFLGHPAKGPVINFLGIPYAQPPIGKLRFQPPRPAKPWNGTLPAKKYGLACLQNPELISSGFDDFTWPQNVSEDCLTLNVHVPGDNISTIVSENMAVMVWIHGGGYVLGGSETYPGEILPAAQGIILVTINYRLDVFGFFTTGDGKIPGNMGLMDQALALRWVQENIGHFGGDKDRVTVFGESAGAMSASLHIISPHSQGLIRRAICQSGMEITRVFPERKNQNVSRAATDKLQCRWDNVDELVNCLQNADAKQIFKAGLKPDTPIVDGDNGFLPKQPNVLWDERSFKAVDLMAGTMKDDGNIITNLIFQTSAKFIYKNGIDYPFIPMYVGALIPFTYLDTFPPKLNTYVMNQYFNQVENPISNLRGLMDLCTDMYFYAQTHRAVDVMTRFEHQQNSFLYYFTHKGPFPPLDTPIDFGPGHGEDIGYVYGYFTDYTDIAGWMYNYSSPADRAISESLMHAWASFAKSGKPKYLDANGTEYEWLPYDQANEYYLDIESDIGPGSMKKRLLPRPNSFWNKIIPSMLAEKECADQDDNPSLISRENAETALFLLCAVVLCLLLALLIVCANYTASKSKSGTA